MTRAREISNVLGRNIESTTFTATAGQTAFSIAHTENRIQVFMNGLLLDQTVDWTSDGSTVTLTSGATAGDELEVVKYDNLSVANVVPSTGGTFSGKIIVNGELESTGDVYGEGGQLTLRAHPSYNYRFNVDNYQDKLRVVKEDDATGANGAVYMQIDSGGRVTRSSQPFVHVTSATGGWNFTTGASLFPFNNIVGGNIGSHFNTSTHLFTCPVAGYYEVTVSALAGNGPDHGSLHIAVNGAIVNGYAHQNYNGTANGWHNLVTTGIFSLSANDTLSSKFTNSGTHAFYTNSHYSHMTIKLL